VEFTDGEPSNNDEYFMTRLTQAGLEMMMNTNNANMTGSVPENDKPEMVNW